MITAGIKELKNQLSRYMGYVKSGEDVLITERGRVIARVVKEGPQGVELRKTLQSLSLRGQINLPLREIDREVPEPCSLPGKSPFTPPVAGVRCHPLGLRADP
jgi:prevent-host-death family protein